MVFTVLYSFEKVRSYRNLFYIFRDEFYRNRIGTSSALDQPYGMKISADFS